MILTSTTDPGIIPAKVILNIIILIFKTRSIKASYRDYRWKIYEYFYKISKNFSFKC